LSIGADRLIRRDHRGNIRISFESKGIAMKLLDGKIAVVTGAARGIGAAVAERFAEEGAEGVAIVDIDPASANAAADEIARRTGCICISVRADVSDEHDVREAIRAILAEFGRIDVLVNNAGILKSRTLEEITPEDWDRTMAVNVKGTFLFARAALEVMKTAGGGKIVNMSSQAGKTGGAMVGPDYAASKAAILCLTKTLAKNAAPYGIHVNSVAPGLIESEMTKDFKYDPSMVPLARKGQIGEVANVVLFLASGLSDYVTGACIDVNGGMSMW
jgi:3-oxoacyl-[acyl-carrier protein] reductase